MTRHEQDREDLMREATALVERVELRLPREDETVVVGFRRDGSLSVYFGADPVYQFNAAGELRRAYVGGLLYKAERGRLVELTRVREPARVVLLRRELDDERQRMFLTAMSARLAACAEALRTGPYAVAAHEPGGRDILPRVRAWLEERSEAVVARTPRAN
jgi:hypothetical protein